MKLTVIKNLGMYLVVDYEIYHEPRKTKKGELEPGWLETGRAVVANNQKKYCNEMWEWNRSDIEGWYQDNYGDVPWFRSRKDKLMFLIDSGRLKRRR